MKPLISRPNPAQPGMFRPRPRDVINPNHPLVKLAGAVDWLVFEKNLNPLFSGTARQARPVRLMVGLQYLKCAFNHGDESVPAVWVQNPCWRHFCGGVFFEHTPPIDPSSMTHWRAYLKEAGVGEMLAETIGAGLRGGFIKRPDTQRVNVDATVREKNVRFSTDARSLDRSRARPVKRARARGIVLRQTHSRVGKRALRQHSGYAHAKRFNRAQREEKRLRTYLGRVVRDVERKCKGGGRVERGVAERAPSSEPEEERPGASGTRLRGRVRHSDRPTLAQGDPEAVAVLVETAVGDRAGDRARETREPDGSEPTWRGIGGQVERDPGGMPVQPAKTPSGVCALGAFLALSVAGMAASQAASCPTWQSSGRHRGLAGAFWEQCIGPAERGLALPHPFVSLCAGGEDACMRHL